MQANSRQTVRRGGWKRILPVLFFCAAIAQAQTITPLADFTRTTGSAPGGAFIQGLDGNFYGAAGVGGARDRGAVMVATPSGAISDLFSFCKATTCPTGVTPYLSLLQVSNGDFFGFTSGTSNNGTIFRLSPAGVINNLYDFCANNICTDGQSPRTNMIQARNGYIYGTTNAGGTSHSAGTIFRMTTAGALTTVYDFCQLTNCHDGGGPLAFGGGLIQATDGNLYGVTRNGGKGFGTIYQLSLSGTLKTIYKFCKAGAGTHPCIDGSQPLGLVEGLDGNFYGVASGAGANGGGVFFKLTRYGGLTVLYNFCSQAGCADGEGPISLILGSDGNFYGTTANPTSDAAIPNTIFQITPAGVLTVLYSTDLRTESGLLSLMQSTDGNFYATNDVGGANNLGTFFKISTGLGPFVRALRPYGFIGQTAYIMGTGLTGSTSVTFSGVAATTFSVVSDSEITAVIPTGSTSGALQVVTPDGTLSGVVPFQVFH